MSPFLQFKNFDDCTKKNKDKDNPKAYCATIMRKVEKNPRTPNPYGQKSSLRQAIDTIVSACKVKKKEGFKCVGMSRNLEKELRKQSLLK